MGCSSSTKISPHNAALAEKELRAWLTDHRINPEYISVFNKLGIQTVSDLKKMNADAVGQVCSSLKSTEALKFRRAILSKSGEAGDVANENAARNASPTNEEAAANTTSSGGSCGSDDGDDGASSSSAQSPNNNANAVVPIAEVVQFIDGDDGAIHRAIEYEKQNNKVFTWLKGALLVAHVNESTKQSIVRLLAVHNFTANMKYMQIFEPLQQFSQEKLLRIGAPLQQLYNSSNDIRLIATLPPNLHPDVSTTDHLRQDHSLVGLSAIFFDLSTFKGESIYIHYLRVIGLLLNERFQNKVKDIVTPFGGSHKGCTIKGDIRMRNKALAAVDHRYKKKTSSCHEH